MNRSIGLLDFLPEVIAKPVREKIRFVHDIRTSRQLEPRAVAEMAVSQ